jgi:GTP cyclohydrolase-4
MTHRAYLGLGSNLGDREFNLLEALERLRLLGDVVKVSRPYETEPVGYPEQPRFLNVAVVLETELEPGRLLRELKRIEAELGRVETVRFGPRPIDLDILVYDDLTLQTPELTIPHPRLTERAFALVPLAEVAPDLIVPGTGLTVRELAARVDAGGVEPARWELRALLGQDLQAERPPISLPLTWVGVGDLERMVSFETPVGRAYCPVRVWVGVSLGPARRGIHASRFGEALDGVLADGLFQPGRPDELAVRLAAEAVQRQQAEAGHVRLVVRYPLSVTGAFCTVTAEARHRAGQVRAGLGVELVGMTVCPCGLELVSQYARRRLEAAGGQQSGELLGLLPLASHAQRARLGVFIGTDRLPLPERLAGLAQAALSAETADTLKRPEELMTILKGHRRPRFAEDVVRDLLARLLRGMPELPDSAYVEVRLANEESIHPHDITVTWTGTMGMLRGGSYRPLSREAWFDGVDGV